MPASDKNMDGKVGRVPAGYNKRGSRPPANPINRLGAFGHPPKSTRTKGVDGYKMERKATRPGALPANMEGRNNPVPRGGRRVFGKGGGKGKRTPVDNANRINRGTPPGYRVKDLANKL
jgi:hypothetical protein